MTRRRSRRAWRRSGAPSATPTQLRAPASAACCSAAPSPSSGKGTSCRVRARGRAARCAGAPRAPRHSDCARADAAARELRPRATLTRPSVRCARPLPLRPPPAAPPADLGRVQLEGIRKGDMLAVQVRPLAGLAPTQGARRGPKQQAGATRRRRRRRAHYHRPQRERTHRRAGRPAPARVSWRACRCWREPLAAGTSRRSHPCTLRPPQAARRMGSLITVNFTVELPEELADIDISDG